MKIRVPLLRRRRGAGVAPFPEVKLWVRDRFGGYVQLRFRIDTQSDAAAIPVEIAHREGIPFSSAQPGTAYGLVGSVPKYRATVRVLIRDVEYEWPCDFVAQPAARPAGTGVAELSAVLGRAGFLDEFALAVDSGFLILTRLGPLRRLTRRLLHGLWHIFRLIHPSDRPL
jgi:hypothetical protein